MRKFNTALMTVTFVAAVSWGVTFASIWLPVDARALPTARTVAATSTVAVMLMCCVRWLGGRAMTYLLDAMLIQRAGSRERRTATVPFRVVR